MAQSQYNAHVLDVLSQHGINSAGPAMLRCVKCNSQTPNLGAPIECELCGADMVPLLELDLDQVEGAAPALAIHRVLSQYLAQNKVNFTLAGVPMVAEQILQPEGILPIIAIEALRLWQLFEVRPASEPAPNDTLGVNFEQKEGTLFPYRARLPAVGTDSTSVLRLLVFVLAMRRVLAIREGQTIDLTPFVRKWDTIEWDGAYLPDIPIPKGFDARFQHVEFETRRVSPAPIPQQPGGQTDLTQLAQQATPSPFASQRSQVSEQVDTRFLAESAALSGGSAPDRAQT